MIEVKKEGIIIRKTELKFENNGVLNPAVFQDGKDVHIFYRAVADNNYSTIGYCKLSGPLEVVERFVEPVLSPTFEYESHGIEDPRIVKIDNIYYVSYTAYDGVNALGCLAISHDMVHFEKRGIVVPKITIDFFTHVLAHKKEINQKYHRYNQEWKYVEFVDKHFIWDKNLIFFPRRINGKLCFIHRIKPDIQLVLINELEELTQKFWEEYLVNIESHIVLTAKYKHEISYIGGGCPPIETEYGWLLIYHSVFDTVKGYVYATCAALLDLENPLIELARLPYPLIYPEKIWELEGEVNNVCFPTGTAIFDDTLYIYYGAADERIACASTSYSGLVKTLLSFINTPTQNEKSIN
jgi:predicted GH43/DUF377 family glycosyl hydrolase